MKKRIFPLLLCVCMLLSALGVHAFATTEEAYSATIMDAYGGAKGVVSMTFDDGDITTVEWLDSAFAKYGLRGSVMSIVKSNYKITESEVDGETVYTPNQTWIDRYNAVYENGRLEPESHTYTHTPLPSDSWAASQDDPESYLAYNTEENYYKELVLSKQLLEDYTGHDVITLAPSNNTLSDGAMAVVMKNYYAVRQGSRFSVGNLYDIQSLDPVVGSAEKGGWYNLAMLGFYDGEHAGVNTTFPNALAHISQNGGWIVTMCHNIRESSGDATIAEAEALFAKINEYQKAGTVWVATFGEATRYIRERQNSTVTYEFANDKGIVNVTMASTTEDGLPLDADVFNHPLTVRISLPAGVEAVKYTLDGEECSSTTFVENDTTYAYVNVVPNSGDIEVTPVVTGGIFSASDLENALDTGGRYKLVGDIEIDASYDLTALAEEVVIELEGNTITFTGKNTIRVNEGSSVVFRNGNVVIAHSYKEGDKSFGNYLPIVQQEDGTYKISSKTAIDTSVFSEEDLKQTLSLPAFSVAGGSLALDGVCVERNVSVSGGGQLVEASEGATLHILNSELYVSAPAEAWANAVTYIIKLTRSATPTKLTIEESYIHEVTPTNCYNGVYYCNDKGPGAIDATTGEVTDVGYITDGNDSLRICYVEGTTANTGVEITVTDSDIVSQQAGFISKTLFTSSDTLTMKDSYMKIVKNGNYKERGFEFWSAELVYENCYLDMADNIFTINDSGNNGTTSVVMRGCFVLGGHTFRDKVSSKNYLFFENTYIQNGLLRWLGYDDAETATEGTDANLALPVVHISGKFYTGIAVSENIPYFTAKDDAAGIVAHWTDGETVTNTTNVTTNFWFNIQKTNESDEIFAKTTPDWVYTVRDASGKVDIQANSPTVSEGDTVYLWQDSEDAFALVADGAFNVVSRGHKVTLTLTSEENFSVVDGAISPVSVIKADGTHLYYINDADKNLQTVFSTLASGETAVLHADQQVTASLYPAANTTVALDLNGHTLYYAAVDDELERLQPTFGVSNPNDKFYIYSSAPGARVLNGYTLMTNADGELVACANRGGNMMQVARGTLALGYGMDGEARGESIDLVGGQLLIQNSGTFLANNTDWYSVSNDNSTVLVFYKNQGDRTFHLSNSNIYMAGQFNRILLFRELTTDTVNATFENCNIYCTNASKSFLAEFKTGTLQTVQTIRLVNSSVCNVKLGATDKMQLYVEGECHLSEMVSEYVQVAPGYGAVAGTASVRVSGTSYPQNSLYGGIETSIFNKSFNYACTVSAYENYKKSLYTNVTLDTALDLHLYIPKSDTLSSVLVDGVECFDSEAVETINGTDYYKVTISKAPKVSYKTALVEITYMNGTSVSAFYRLEHSLLNYAQSLFSLDESKYSGNTLAYLTDSKEMMRYVLNYAREVIEAYGQLDETTLAEVLKPFDTMLSDFVLSEDDLVLEDVKTDLPTGTGTAAAFDLDSAVGFALGVYNSFTGTVSITIDDRSESGEFVATIEDGATPEIVGYVLIENIVAYKLYSADIEITVTGTNAGEEVNVTFTYNLATYTNSGVSEDVGTSLYAYTRKANEYGHKYKTATIE